MSTGPTETELILRELRKLNAWMNPVEPDPIKLRRFRDLLTELDVLLQTGASFPNSWITKENYTQLPTETTHSITDFDPPPQNTPGFAWCGHRSYFGTEYCGNMSCGNYTAKHPPTPNPELS